MPFQWASEPDPDPAAPITPDAEASPDAVAAVTEVVIAGDVDEWRITRAVRILHCCISTLQAPDASLVSGNPFDQFDAAALGSAAANPRAYRVTGLVLEVNDSMIAMQKGKDRWEIGRNLNTKVTGDLKVGAKGDDNLHAHRHRNGGEIGF